MSKSQGEFLSPKKLCRAVHSGPPTSAFLSPNVKAISYGLFIYAEAEGGAWCSVNCRSKL